MKTALATMMLLGAASAITPEAAADEVTNLPGIPDGVNFKMYAGYIPVGSGKEIFYWIAESQNKPATDPVMIWTNGGPGCSGLGGFMTEQGPFRPTKEGNLTWNAHAWNKVANMVFIEQPAGVGFSYPKGLSFGDDQAAEDNHAFILGLLKRYPQYQANDLYITSESYGGHYMPTLGQKIIQKGDVKNFKGIFVGNPLTYMPYRNYGEFATFAGHSLLPKPMWDEYNMNNCANTTSTVCTGLENQMTALTNGLDAYALDYPVCTTSEAAGRHERHTLIKHMKAAGAKLGGYFPDNYTPCDGNWEVTYLNRPDVQKAIHARVGTKWEDCGGINYHQADMNVPMMPIWKDLIAHGGLKLVVYSGDDDSVCASLGSQQFIWNMGLGIKKQWSPWTMLGQVGGWITKFDGFTFVTVHGAGHMVPATRPAQSLELLTRYLAGELTN
eukprot:Rhum_TRINITY_DN18492_c0_g1::Rhum_TRINITY_DN18492_c0_g1_i1::g.167437::m.167437/K16297/SCPL-II; serine carboxypeptidase-like clade II